jgi:sugar transferase (PEP-CTERM/EpsH1 system associated)
LPKAGELTMPIRIMHVVDNMGRGGMQNGLVNLIARLDPARFEHTICTTRYLDESKSHRLPDRVPVVCVANGARFQFPALLQSIKEWKPDIIHSRNWGGVEAILAGRRLRIPALVHSEHGLDAETTTAEPRRRIWFRRLVYHLSHRVLCVSEELKRFHARRTGFPERRMQVIHNGVDTDRFAPDPAARAAMRRELGIPDSDFLIGCVGNLSAVKDYPTVLRAIDVLHRSCKNYRLIIGGEGPERKRLEEIIRAHPEWQERVRLLGLSNRIPELLNALDCYVLGSLTEGISNSLLEAMATGLPVVATVTGGNPEVVVDGQSGILFPVGDASSLAAHLVRLQAKPEERSRLGEGALRRVRTSFSLEAMVQNYAELYQSLAPEAAVRHREVACI